MPFKDISYLKFWWPLCSAERNHLCSFGPGRYEEYFCEIILNYFEFGPVVQMEMLFKDISYLKLWWPFIQWSGTICAILVDGMMRNNSVKLF